MSGRRARPARASAIPPAGAGRTTEHSTAEHRSTERSIEHSTETVSSPEAGTTRSAGVSTTNTGNTGTWFAVGDRDGVSMRKADRATACAIFACPDDVGVPPRRLAGAGTVGVIPDSGLGIEPNGRIPPFQNHPANHRAHHPANHPASHRHAFTISTPRSTTRSVADRGASIRVRTDSAVSSASTL